MNAKANNHESGQNPEDLARRVREFACSAEGQESLSRTINQAVQETERLREARQIDPKILHEPMTL